MDHLVKEPQPSSNIVQQDTPPFFVLMLLLVAVLIGLLIGNLTVLIVSNLMGHDLQKLLLSVRQDSPLEIRNMLRTINLVSHFTTFTLSSVILALFLYKKKMLSYFKLDKMPSINNLGFGVLFIMASFPLAIFIMWINQQIPLPEWAVTMEESASGMLKSVLNMQSPVELLFNLLVVAVLPAVGEELLFRGVVQQQIEKSTKNGILAIWITATVFSAIHLQFEGFFPRLLLGAILGYLFYWTKNLWVPILAHFVFNGTQIVGKYFYQDQVSIENSVDFEKIPWLPGIIGILIMLFIGNYIRQHNASKAEQQELVQNEPLDKIDEQS
ncbi:MAG: type II CAAX endopeptidase family protein [Bacteroidota bacterium]